MDRAELRPLSVGEIVDAAFTLVRRNFGQLLKLAAAILVPLGAVQLVVAATVGNVQPVDVITADTADPAAVLDAFIRVLIPLLVVAVISYLGTLLVEAGAIRLYADRYQGSSSDWRESLAYGARRFPAVLGAALLIGLGTVVGAAFCLLPGILVYTAWWVTIPALMVEGRGPVRSLGRSWSLVLRRFWGVFGVAVLATVITWIVSQVVGTAVSLATLVPRISGANPSMGLPIAISSVSQTVVSLVTVPFLAAVATVVYFDLRVRAEGYDLELMTKEIGAEAEALPPEGPSAPGPADPDDPFGLGRPGS